MEVAIVCKGMVILRDQYRPLTAAGLPKLVTVRWYRYAHTQMVCTVSSDLVEPLSGRGGAKKQKAKIKMTHMTAATIA
jgi:hypothetical protein